MNHPLLKLRHWQVFILFALGYLLINWLFSYSFLVGYGIILLVVGFVGWYALLGNTLYQYLPRGVTYSISWFLADAFLIIAVYGATLILFNGNLELSGFAAIPGLYFFFAIAHLFWFPAVALVAAENKAAPAFSQYAGTLIQLVVWPVGIWFIQPRLNRIAAEIEAGSFKYSL